MKKIILVLIGLVVSSMVFATENKSVNVTLGQGQASLNATWDRGTPVNAVQRRVFVDNGRVEEQRVYVDTNKDGKCDVYIEKQVEKDRYDRYDRRWSNWRERERMRAIELARLEREREALRLEQIRIERERIERERLELARLERERQERLWRERGRWHNRGHRYDR